MVNTRKTPAKIPRRVEGEEEIVGQSKAAAGFGRERCFEVQARRGVR